jgi:hypothetical protein
LCPALSRKAETERATLPALEAALTISIQMALFP